MSLSFYTAGKIWHADKFKTMRDWFGLPIRARWIDLNQDSDIVANHKDQLWQMCYEDVRDSDFVLLYAGNHDEEQRGALVEIGMAYGMGKRVYAYGSCKSIKPNAISDVAFTHHHLWTWLDAFSLIDAATKAMALESQHQLAKKVA